MHLNRWYPILLSLWAHSALGQGGFSISLGAPGTDEAFGCAAMPDQAAAVCGTTQALDPANYPDAFVMKVDSTGGLAWQMVLGAEDRADRFRTVIRASNGDVVAIGETGGLPGPWPQAMVARMTAEGTLLWCKRYPAATWGHGLTVVELDNGHLLCAADMIQGLAVYLRLLELDADGTPVWSTFYDTPSDTQAGTDLIRTSDGGSLLVGTVNVSPGINAGFALKTGPTGQVDWYRRYFSTEEDTRLVAGIGTSSAQADGFLLVGTQADGDTLAPNLLLLSISANGAINWARTVPDAEASDVEALNAPATGALVACRTLGTDTAMAVLCTDEAGNVLWGKAATATGMGGANALCTQPGGHVVLAGGLLPPGPVDEAAFVARMVSGTGPEACAPFTPHTSTPALVTDSAAAYTLNPLNSTAFDLGFSPNAGLAQVNAFCVSTAVPTIAGPTSTGPNLVQDGQGHLRILWPPADPRDVVQVYDGTGRLERTGRYGAQPVDLSGLAPGVHLVSIGGSHPVWGRFVLPW